MEGRVEQEARVDDGKIRVACDYLSPAIFPGSDRIGSSSISIGLEHRSRYDSFDSFSSLTALILT